MDDIKLELYDSYNSAKKEGMEELSKLKDDHFFFGETKYMSD